MKRKLFILLMVFVVILIAVAISSLRRKEAHVSFSRLETQQVKLQGPYGPRVRAIVFYATNSANRPVYLQVSAIETNGASGWVADTNALPAHTYWTIGPIGPRQPDRVSFDLPNEPGPTRLRILVSPEGTILQKTRFAVERWWANLRGKEHNKHFWFDYGFVATYEVVTPEFQ